MRTNVTGPEEAFLRTVVYSGLFQYPLTPTEVAASLQRVLLAPAEVARLYRDSPLLRALVDFRRGFFFERGDEHLLEIRERREATSREMWRRNRRLLARMAALPTVRLLALSGSAD